MCVCVYVCVFVCSFVCLFISSSSSLSSLSSPSLCDSELGVYFVSLHEIARQVFTHCQERAELMHNLIQRCALLVQAIIPIAQREVVASVVDYKEEIERTKTEL